MTGFLYQISAVLKFEVDTVNKGLKIKIKMIEPSSPRKPSIIPMFTTGHTTHPPLLRESRRTLRKGHDEPKTSSSVSAFNAQKMRNKPITTTN